MLDDDVIDVQRIVSFNFEPLNKRSWWEFHSRTQQGGDVDEY